jgi:hypothetical protein
MTSYAIYFYEETNYLTLLTVSQRVIDVGLRNLHIRVVHSQMYCYVSFQKTEVKIRSFNKLKQIFYHCFI